MHQFLPFLARLLMAPLFLYAGYQKLIAPLPTREFLHHIGLPGMAVYLIILLELGGGIFLFAGIYTRAVALLFAVYCLLTAFLVHYHPHNPEQLLQLLKDCCIAGGFFVLAAHAGGSFSLGRRLGLKWS